MKNKAAIEFYKKRMLSVYDEIGYKAFKLFMKINSESNFDELWESGKNDILKIASNKLKDILTDFRAGRVE
jgi:hypothetical protein